MIFWKTIFFVEENVALDAMSVKPFPERLYALELLGLNFLVLQFDKKNQFFENGKFYYLYDNKYYCLFTFFQIFRKEPYCYMKSFYSAIRKGYYLLFLKTYFMK